eukprot:SAG31_NODE_7155_length_1772_cov_1.494322_2_plen_143_part_01
MFDELESETSPLLGHGAANIRNENGYQVNGLLEKFDIELGSFKKHTLPSKVRPHVAMCIVVLLMQPRFFFSNNIRVRIYRHGWLSQRGAQISHGWSVYGVVLFVLTMRSFRRDIRKGNPRRRHCPCRSDPWQLPATDPGSHVW